jgi:hypothetical protein
LEVEKKRDGATNEAFLVLARERVDMVIIKMDMVDLLWRGIRVAG